MTALDAAADFLGNHPCHFDFVDFLLNLGNVNHDLTSLLHRFQLHDCFFTAINDLFLRSLHAVVDVLRRCFED